MKKIIPIICSAAIAVSAFNVYAKDADEKNIVEIHVSPNGSDSNSGTADSPLRTLDSARIKASKKKDNNTSVKVIFHDGIYRMSEGVNFTNADSGFEGNPIVYMAAEGEKPIFKGSIEIDTSKFTGVTDKSIYDRLPEVSADKVGQLDLKQQGLIQLSSLPVVNYGSESVDYHQFYLDDTAQTLARWPNTGYTTMGKLVNATAGVFAVNESNAARWGTADDMMLAGFPHIDWAYERPKVLSVDPEKRYVTLDTKLLYGKKVDNTNGRYFVYNLIEELDEPGEWYIDRDSFMLYYYPMYPTDKASFEMSVLTQPFITVTNASNIVFEGLEFSQGMADGIMINGCDNIKITKSYLHDLGRIAVNNNGTFCSNVEISDSKIFNIGSRGIQLQGGNAETLEASGHVIKNNYISACGQIRRSYAGGVALNGVGTIIENNVINNMPHTALQVGGALHKVRYNEIYDVCYEANDMGAIYAGRNAYNRGVEISYNYIHDLIPPEGLPGLICGVYWDDSLSGEYVHHNIFKNIPRSVFTNSGSDHKIYNNIVIDSTYGIQIGYGSSSLTPNQNLFIDALAMADKFPVYYEKFPEMRLIDINYTRTHNNLITDNYMVNAYGTAITDCDNEIYWGEDLTKKNYSSGNVSTQDYSDFVDADKGIYELSENAEVLKQIPELEKIKIKDIGIQTDILNDIEEKEFIKIYPKNGAANVSTSGFYLKWQPSQYRVKYHVVVAKDKDLKDIVFEADTYRNYAFCEGLESGNTEYFWNVTSETAASTLKTGKKDAYGATYSFSTANREYLNQIILSESIKNAEELANSITAGNEAGQCDKQQLDNYKAVINEVKLINKKKFGNQTEVDKANEKITEATLQMPSYIYKGYASLDEWLERQDNWQIMGDDKVNYVKDGEIHLSGGSHILSNELVKTYQIYKFKVKVDKLTNMLVIAYKIQGIGNPWGNTSVGYSFYLKNNIFEFQRYSNGGGILETKENNGIIKPGEWAEVEVGAMDVPGGIQAYLKINDTEIFNYFDESGLITKDGYLQFSLYGNDNAIITSVDDLGTFDSSIVIGSTVEYDEPELYDKNLLNAKAFTANNGTVREENGATVFKSDGDNGEYRLNAELSGNEIFEFDMQACTEGKGQAVAVRGISASDEYRIKFNDNTIELIRYSKDGNHPLFVADNKYLKNNSFARVKVGAFDTENGTRIVLYIDSKKVIDCTDMYKKIKSGGLRFYDTNMKGMIIK